jgi:hypothetical protein
MRRLNEYSGCKATTASSASTAPTAYFNFSTYSPGNPTFSATARSFAA